MYDVAIIGGGPAGAALAALMARGGRRVLLLERSAAPRHKVCGEFLSPEAITSLEELGLRSALERLAPVSIRSARLVAPGGSELTLPLPAPAWGLSRLALDPALRSEAARSGAEVRSGAEAVSQGRTSQGWSVRVRSAEGEAEVPARTLVGAAGRRRAPGRGTVGLKCHLNCVGLTEVQLFLFPGGYAGLAPVESGRVNFAALLSPPALRQAGSSLEGLLAWLSARSPRFAAARAAENLIPDSSAAISGVRTNLDPEPWAAFPQLGDGAAMLPPFCGDGQAAALRSAQLLAPLLEAHLSGQVSAEGLQWRYQREWYAAFGRMIRTAHRLEPWLLRPIPSRALMLAAGLYPALATRLFAATRSRPLTPHISQGGALS